MNTRWLIRMVRLARNPPGPKRIRVMLVIAALIGGVLVVEHTIGWPQWARVNRLPR